MKNLPRYIVRAGELSDMPTYEFPMQSLQRTKPALTLVVETNLGFTRALERALEWAAAHNANVHDVPALMVYPKVRATSKNTSWMATKVTAGMTGGTTAWIEQPNGGRGMWHPVETLSL